MRSSSRCALLASLLACAHAPVAPQKLVADCALHQTAPGMFRFELTLNRPLAALHFSRGGDGDRLRTWRVVEPVGAKLAADGKKERIEANTPFTRAVLDVPVHRYLPEKDYAPFLPLSGGGVLVYSGAFDLEEADAQTFALQPLPGESVVARGQTAKGPLRWETKFDDGTYLAFGPVAPVEGQRFVAVIDGGFPPWLADEARSLLPKLFDWYAAALGRELPGRLAVMLSFGTDSERPRSISMKGGTLDGLLQQDVVLGKDRLTPGDATVLQHFRLTLAHEAAHLWNAQLIRPRGPDWVHEGGADVLAWQALRGLGLITEEERQAELQKARETCTKLRGKGKLQDDPVKARYACGAILETEATNDNPASAWRKLVERGKDYDDADFYSASAKR